MCELNNFFSGLLYIETFVILVLAFYSWRRRKAPGAFPLFIMCISVAFYTFGYSMEIVSNNIESVNFWSKVQYLGLPFIPATWIVQACSLINSDKKISRVHVAILFIIPVLTCIFRWTDKYHGLMYKSMSLVSNGHFNVLVFEKGPWYYLHYTFFCICAIVSIAMYYYALFKATGYIRQQFRVMFYASILYCAAQILYQFGMVPLQIDCGPFVTFFIYLLFAYAIYNFDMMHIIPLSRDKIFEWIYDGVIVVDLNYNLKDFNHAAKQIFRSLDKSLIGTRIELCTSECPEFFKLLKKWCNNEPYSQEQIEEGSLEDIFEFYLEISKEEISYFKARLKPLYNKEIRIGSTLLITDITKEKEMLLKLERAAQIDGLTGIFNRRYFMELANIEFTRLLQQSGNGVLVMFDIDHFKQINDTYGHQAGDYVLKEVVVIAKLIMGNDSLLGRYGGEEFIVFLPNMALDQAMAMIELVRTALEKHVFNYNSKLIKVTASFGIAESCKQKYGIYCSFEEMIRSADSVLYQAKRDGRNQIAACKVEDDNL